MGGGGKDDGGGGGGTISTTTDPAMSAAVSEMTATSRPVRNEVYRQVLEAMTTGGIGARLPIVQRGVEASRAATSSAMRQIDAGMAGTGLARSPYAQNLRNQALLQGELAANAIPTNVAKEYIDIAPALASGSSAQILTGLAQAAGIGQSGNIANAQIQASRDIAKGNQQAGMLSSLGQMAAMWAMASR